MRFQPTSAVGVDATDNRARAGSDAMYPLQLQSRVVIFSHVVANRLTLESTDHVCPKR
jgi:hypothetical protein